ncbi:MAG: YajQ family cyclic di-GMP-binding protein [Cyclonatronaceae bacterium]
MPSFDVVNEIDIQELDNAVNNAAKEIGNRYDFRDSKTEIDFNRKDKTIRIVTENEMRFKAVRDTLTGHIIKRGISSKALEFGEPEGTSHGGIRILVAAKEGIDRDNAKKIVKLVKDSRLKVQPAIMDDKVRITGKKIDDLQEVISMLKKAEMPLPLQYINMKN